MADHFVDGRLQRVWLFGAALALCATSTLATRDAHAEVPSCQGSDTATQNRARADGLRRYRAATARGDINRAEMAAALESFEAQCRAGDVNALEMRAYALAALGRHVDAAESLDAFLAARPLQTLDADARARVGSQRGAILAEVGTLSVEGAVADASIVVNGRPYGSVPRDTIRVAPGEITLQVFAPSLGAVRRVFTMGPGETRRETIDGRGATTSVDPTGTDPVSPVDSQAPRRPPVLAIGLGGGALLMVGALVGTTVWHGGRVAELSKSECNPPADDELTRICGAVAGERDTARALQITSGVLAGGLAVGAGVALGLWFASAPRRSPAASVACVPTLGANGGGLSCGARF
jgi:hypothetical protein